MRGEQDCRVARLAAIVLLALPLAGCRPTTSLNIAQLPRIRLRDQRGSATVSIYDVVNVRLDRELPVARIPLPSPPAHAQ